MEFLVSSVREEAGRRGGQKVAGVLKQAVKSLDFQRGVQSCSSASGYLPGIFLGSFLQELLRPRFQPLCSYP